MEKINKQLKCFLVILTGLYFSGEALAHGCYILPSHTVLSGEKAQVVTSTAAITNNIFHPDRPFGNNEKGINSGSLAGLFKDLTASVTHPDGESESMTWQAFGRLSVADLTLENAGTYRIGLDQFNSLMLTFTNADGSKGRRFGNESIPPKGAKDIKRYEINARTEAFVTKGTTTASVWGNNRKGLSAISQQHPNDLFVNEPLKLQMLFNGEPAKEIDVKIVRGGTRHRNDREELNLTTDEKGFIEVSFDAPGFYWFEAGVAKDPEQGSPFTKRFFSYYLTLEVFPE